MGSSFNGEDLLECCDVGSRGAPRGIVRRLQAERTRRNQAGRKSLNPERWLFRHASFKALAHFVTIRMPLNRMNLSIQST